VAVVTRSSVTPEPRPLRKDAERNRLRILAAAQQVFAARGLNATLDDIADHAGLGVGTVYRRYANKDELVDALFEQHIDDIVVIAGEALRVTDPWAAVVCFFERTQSRQAQDRGLREVLLCGDRGMERVARARDRVVPAASLVLERAQAAGVLRPGITSADIPILSLMLGAVVDFTHDVSPDLWQRYLALLLDGMRARPDRQSLPVQALTHPEMEQVLKLKANG
jgi:AcrR family transcriptional regulator